MSIDRLSKQIPLAPWLLAATMIASGIGGCDGSIGGDLGSGAPGNGAPGPAANGTTPLPTGNGTMPAAMSGLRRLTIYEYDNVVRDLLGDTTRPATALRPR